MTLPPPGSLVRSSRESISAFYGQSYSDNFYSIAVKLLNKVKKSNALPTDISSFKRKMREIHEKCETIDEKVNSKIADTEIPSLIQSSNQVWERAKTELKSMTQMPLRVEFISAQNTELIRIGKKVLTIIETKEKSTILSAELFRAFSQISNQFIDIFMSILNPGKLEIKLINVALESIANLIKELPLKYIPFCFEENSETPTEFYKYIFRYLKKIQSRTQQLLEIGSDPVEVYAFIDQLDSFFEKMCSDFKVSYIIVQNKEELIKNSLRYMDQELYPAVGSKRFFGDVQSMISGSTVVKLEAGMVPWFADPLFLELKRLISEIDELADMRLTRHEALTASKSANSSKEELVSISNTERVAHDYGIKDVLAETTSALQVQIKETKSRSDALDANSLTKLKSFSADKINLENLLIYLKGESKRLEDLRASTVDTLEKRHNEVLDEKDRYLGLIDSESTTTLANRQKIKSLQREIDSARQIIDKAIRENDPLREEIQQLTAEKEALNKRAVELDQENAKIEEEIAAIKKEIAKLQVDDANEMADAEELINKLQDDIENLRIPRKKLKKNLDALNENYSKSTAIIPDLENQRNFLEDEIYEYQIRLKRVKARWAASKLAVLSDSLQHL